MKLNLIFPFPPGDCWCLTRYIRDFATQFPDDELAPVIPSPEIFRFNPYSPMAVPGADQIRFQFEKPVGRPTYGNFNTKDTMVSAIYAGINAKTGRNVEIRTEAPEIYFSQEEQTYSIVSLDRPICVINAGWKYDIPVKFWGSEKFQAVVDAMKDRIQFVQVGASRRGTDFHIPLSGVLNLVGKTTIRELAQLVYHADFVLSGISQLHHLAGIQCYKPRHCITVAGGREPENWANCHRRDGVTWHWISVNKDFRECAVPDSRFHDAPGCWEHECNSGNPPPCMNTITPDEIISIFKENL